MDLKDYQIEILHHLAQYEEAIGHLYLAYSERFPEEKSFWDGLFKDEIGHATWLKKLQGLAESGRVFFQPGRFNTQAITSNLGHVKEKYKEAKEGEISLINALSIALDLEKSLLESEYYRVFDGDYLEVKKIFEDLTQATKAHRQKVEEMWQKHQPKE